MGIKSEKTFEEIVERIVAVFRPQKSSDARDFDDCGLDRDITAVRDSEGENDPNAIGDSNGDADNGRSAPTQRAASQDNPPTRRRRPSSRAAEITF